MAVPRVGVHRAGMRTPGFTLVELLVALLVLGVLLAIAAPPVGRWRDEAAVRAARDELSAALAWTRVAAASHNGATLVLDPATGRFWTERSPGPTPTHDLAARYGVRIDAGSDEAIRVRYDGLGIGRASNRTLRISRRRAEAGLTINLYGRVRRW